MTRPTHTTESDTHVQVTLHLEHPITPGDLERAYCELLEEVSR